MYRFIMAHVFFENFFRRTEVRAEGPNLRPEEKFFKKDMSRMYRPLSRAGARVLPMKLLFLL